MTAYVTRHGIEDSDELIRYAYAISTKYGEAAATIACEMYDKTAAARRISIIPAEPADTADYPTVAKAINGTLKHSQKPEVCGGTVGRLVKQTASDTVLKNAIRDHAQFAWIPGGDSCAYCSMIASGGWRNATKKTANGGHAEHIHPNCMCEFAIRFSEEDNVEEYDPDALRQQYDAAEGDNWKEKVNYMRRSNRVAAEKGLRSKGGSTDADFSVIRSKEYTRRFYKLTDVEDAAEKAAQRARNAIIHRSGKETEELYAVSLKTGKDVTSITNQNLRLQVKRTAKFNADMARAEEAGDIVLLLHNHPYNSPPSIADINELLNHKSAVGCTAGHKGSLYYYTKPNKRITKDDYKRALMKTMGSDIIKKQEDALMILGEKFDFEFIAL